MCVVNLFVFGGEGERGGQYTCVHDLHALCVRLLAAHVCAHARACAYSSSSFPPSLSSSPSTSSVPHTLLPIELAPHGPKHLLELETDSVYLVDDQPSALFLPVKGQTLCLPPYVFKASFVRVGELYVQALRAARCPSKGHMN